MNVSRSIIILRLLSPTSQAFLTNKSVLLSIKNTSSCATHHLGNLQRIHSSIKMSVESIQERALIRNVDDDAKEDRRDGIISSSFNGLLDSIANRKSGTIFITVGPQCAGKTDLLKRIFTANDNSANTEKRSGLDITIDDELLVYIPIGVHHFLPESTTSIPGKNNIFEDFIRTNQMVLGKTILERINDSCNDELRWVIRRLSGKISSDEFLTLLRSQNDRKLPDNPSPAKSNSLCDDLVAAVEGLCSSWDSSFRLPEIVDLFIVESIFRPRPVDLMANIEKSRIPPPFIESSALDSALHLLKTHAIDNQTHPTMAPIAWGNTNTRPREYAAALQAASLSGRPVEFLVFGGMEACDMICEQLIGSDLDPARVGQVSNVYDDGNKNRRDIILPKLSRPALYQRNLQRFLKTGRYIPSNAIDDAINRVDSLLASVISEAKKYFEPSRMVTMEEVKFRLDYELAKLAGYEMHSDRTVSHPSVANLRRVDLRCNTEDRGNARIERISNCQGANFRERRHMSGRQPYFQQNDYRQRRTSSNLAHVRRQDQTNDEVHAWDRLSIRDNARPCRNQHNINSRGNQPNQYDARQNREDRGRGRSY